MFLARVEGSVVATHKHPSLKGFRLRICTPLEQIDNEDTVPIVAFDPYGAGKNQIVMVSTDGASARSMVKDPKSPARHQIVAIVDEVDGEEV